MQELKNVIETAYQHRQSLSPKKAPNEVKNAIKEVVQLLDSGKVRTAEKIDGKWQTNEWVKKAVFLHFCTHENAVISTPFSNFYDKVPLKFDQQSEQDFKNLNIRVVPTAIARHGSYIGSNTILMPSYINIGAYIDSGCMIDTWATVGSCAQIGKNVHLSGGAGIGGVLEPIQSNPTIIEDNCFIGARSEIVEGVIVEEGSVISMGVFIGQSTRIYDRTTGEIYFGKVPAGSVVVPGNLPSNDGKYSLYCAVIVKKVDHKTRDKISLNELLRDIQ